MNKNLILVVEDDEGIRLSMSQYLSFEDYTVMEAENGLEALNKLKSMSPDELPGLIILDLMMPVMDGKAFLNYLKDNHMNDLAKIPILVASANGATALKDQLPLAADFIKKPFNLDDLITKIHGFLR